MDVHHTGIAELHTVTDMRSRKAGLDERADCFVALPGGLGTLEELAEILSFRKLGHHRRRMVLLSTDRFFDPLLALFERAIADGLRAAGDPRLPARSRRIRGRWCPCARPASESRLAAVEPSAQVVTSGTRRAERSDVEQRARASRRSQAARDLPRADREPPRAGVEHGGARRRQPAAPRARARPRRSPARPRAATSRAGRRSPAARSRRARRPPGAAGGGCSARSSTPASSPRASASSSAAAAAGRPAAAPVERALDPREALQAVLREQRGRRGAGARRGRCRSARHDGESRLVHARAGRHQPGTRQLEGARSRPRAGCAARSSARRKSAASSAPAGAAHARHDAALARRRRSSAASRRSSQRSGTPAPAAQPGERLRQVGEVALQVARDARACAAPSGSGQRSRQRRARANASRSDVAAGAPLVEAEIARSALALDARRSRLASAGVASEVRAPR